MQAKDLGAPVAFCAVYTCGHRTIPIARSFQIATLSQICLVRRSPVKPFRSSTQPDPKRLDELAAIQHGCLALVGLVSLTILLGWTIPPLGRTLPVGWAAMKGNTALLALASAASLALSQPRRSERMLKISRWLALVVGLVSAVVLAQYAFGLNLRIDQILAFDRGAAQPGRMSLQTATCFALLSVVMLFLRLRKTLMAYVIDLLAFGLSLLVLVFGSAFLFGAMHLTGAAGGAPISPQTLVCLALLSFVAFGRRAEYGIFSILLGRGIGSSTARLACPCALLMPFAIEAAEAWAIHHDLFAIPVTIAIGTALGAMLAFALVVLLAWRIDTLEKAIRDLSLRDELTQLYNRRGFYLMAEQSLALAQRTRTPFSVLFVDLDNLKLINDSLGHESGSILIAELAQLLKICFRETDVIGRIGGDEFVVASDTSDIEVRVASERLERAAREFNKVPGRKYPLSFSLGFATSDPDLDQNLDDLLVEADKAMYLTKQRKKAPVASWARSVTALD